MNRKIQNEKEGEKEIEIARARESDREGENAGRGGVFFETKLILKVTILKTNRSN